jgi:hypothetical protein
MTEFHYRAAVRIEGELMPAGMSFHVILPGDDWTAADRAAYVKAEARKALERLLRASYGPDTAYEVLSVKGESPAPEPELFRGRTTQLQGVGGGWHSTKG